jgi:hypothetical protein
MSQFLPFFGIRYGKKSDPGSGINIPDSQHCEQHYVDLKNTKDWFEYPVPTAGERPFTCGHCGRGFSRILDKKKHMLLKVCH